MTNDKPLPVGEVAHPLYVAADRSIIVYNAPKLTRHCKFVVETTTIEMGIIGAVTNRHPTPVDDETAFLEDHYEVAFRHPQGLVTIVVRKDALRHVADMPDLRGDAEAAPATPTQGELDASKSKPEPEPQDTTIKVGSVLRLKETLKRVQTAMNGKINLTPLKRAVCKVINADGTCEAEFDLGTEKFPLTKPLDHFELVSQRPA